MLIAIDYDETFTLDPDLWAVFVARAISRGHYVVCATMRYESEGYAVERAFDGLGVSVYFTGRKAKKKYLNGIGIYPDVWIDDSPHFILADARK